MSVILTKYLGTVDFDGDHLPSMTGTISKNFKLDTPCNVPSSAITTVYIVDVIFNEPATIVFWNDGSKTVVKAQNGETFDPEKGLAMAILKRIRGNKGCYSNAFKKWLNKYHPKETGSGENK